jgi:DNA-binding NtrC family response regulator
MSPQPRVLIVMSEDWPRALLRARLRDRGYDAVTAPTLAAAAVFRAHDPERGPIQLLILDQAALAAGREMLQSFMEQWPGMRVLLIALSNGSVPPGPWTAVVRRPFQSDEVPRAVEALVPLKACEAE